MQNGPSSATNDLKAFIVVLARDKTDLPKKLVELKSIGIPFVIICGEPTRFRRVYYKIPIGKWDAINFGSQFVPPEAQLIVLNDSDTKIHCLGFALEAAKAAELVYCKVEVDEGPQRKFYRILDTLRSRLPIVASGELMVANRQLFEQITPIPPCTAEDTFILFRALQLGYRVRFCTQTYVTTRRTRKPEEERAYKLRTTLGVYQSLRLSKPPVSIRVFYALLPFMATILFFGGQDGRAWAAGIEKAVAMHLLRRYGTYF